MASTKLKTLYTYDVLRKFTDENHRVTADQICGLLKKEYGIAAERKGVYRDMEALIEYGADIQKTQTGYYLGDRELKPAEIRLLVSAVQSASFITPTKTKRLINALTRTMSTYKKDELMRQQNLGSVKDANEEIYNTIDAINAAISKRCKISFYYYKKNVRKQEMVQHNGMAYHASPYAMIWFNDRYYLVCNLDGHDDLTHFRLDRIRKIRCEQVPWRHFSEVSDFKSTFDASKYAASCVNMFGGEITSVTLICKNELVNEILDKFGQTTPIQRVDDERFRTIVTVAMSDGFLAWVAQFFDGIEIVSPDSAREHMKKLLSSATDMYR